MTLGRLVGFIIVLAIAGAGLHYAGILNFDKSGAPVMPDGGSAEVDAYVRAEGLFMSSRYGEALGAYQGALQKSPDHKEAATARFRIGKCLEELKRGKEALAAYREFIAKHGSDGRASRAQERIEYLQSQYGK